MIRSHAVRRRAAATVVPAAFAALVTIVVLLIACARTTRSGDRCAFCGMKIDPGSAWRAELIQGATTTRFDTPRCALLAWRSGKIRAERLRVQEFYDREWRDGGELRFAVGSDVLGPMGQDLVPLDPSRVAKFRADHAASDTLALDAITAARLESIR